MGDEKNDRIRIEPGSQRIRVEVGGVTVAESTRPTLLHETGLPTRYYLPKQDVRQELLEPSDTVTHCPYKGDAEYWSVRVDGRLYRDVVWSYPTPFARSEGIAGLVSFLGDGVDVRVD